MGETFDDAYMVHSSNETDDWVRPKHMKGYSNDRRYYTPDEEIVLINKQIEESEGFDINFEMFRCLFSYHPVDFSCDVFVEEPETNADLLMRLSRKSLDNYNQENNTGYKFDKLLYANFHMSAGVMFLITFQAKDPTDDNQPKDFQARIRYSFHDESNFVFCRLKPKPNQQDSSTDEDAEKDLKKPRLE